MGCNTGQDNKDVTQCKTCYHRVYCSCGFGWHLTLVQLKGNYKIVKCYESFHHPPDTPLTPQNPYSTPGLPGQTFQTSFLSPVPSDPLPCDPHCVICHTVTLVMSHLSHQDPWHQVWPFMGIPFPYWDFQ